MSDSPKTQEPIEEDPYGRDPRLRNFKNFLFLVWRHLGLPDPTSIQYDIAHELEHGPNLLVILALRGIGKSWITSVYVCWLLYWHPEWQVLVVSAGKDRSDDFSTFTLRLLREIPFLTWLQPRESEGQRGAKVGFDVGPAPPAHSASVRSRGIMGQITGARADVIIADDVEVPSNSETDVMRAKVAQRTKEFTNIIKPDGHTKIIYLGTPQVEQSLYNELPARGYEIRVWPGRMPETETKYQEREEQFGPYIQRLRAQAEDYSAVADRPTDTRFPEEVLMRKEAELGRTDFALHFRLDTSLSDENRYPLKLSDLIVMDMDDERAPERLVYGRNPEGVWDVPTAGLRGDRYYRPMSVMGEFIKYQGAVLHIDPAGRGKDELAWIVTKMLNSNIYTPLLMSASGGYTEENLRAIALDAKRHKVNKIIIESNFGDGMFAALLRPILRDIYPCAIEEIKHSTQKEKRIVDTLEPVMNRHQLVVSPAVIEDDYRRRPAHASPEASIRYTLAYQMTRVTRERKCLRHDDRLDVLAMAVAYWVEHMGGSSKDAMARRRQELIDEELAGMAKSGSRVWRDGRLEKKPKGRVGSIFDAIKNPASRRKAKAKASRSSGPRGALHKHSE